MSSLKKIISGGQTGADRAALDAAYESSFELGGYCPKNRKAEDGTIDNKYPLTEIEGGYKERTLKNVITSDLTAIFYKAPISGGTKQTQIFCTKHNKPYELIEIKKINTDQAIRLLDKAIDKGKTRILNVAGPRLSECPEIYNFVKSVILGLIEKK